MRIELKFLVTVFLALFVLSSCNKDSYTYGDPEPDKNYYDTDPHPSKFGTPSGAVYTMDNALGANHVLVFNRSANGSLTGPKRYATHGGGSGAGLGSQGSIVSYGDHLYVVNAGSNEISVFRKVGKDLKLIDKVGSKGVMPTSLTVHDDVIYVLNAGGSGNISGFRFRYDNLNFIYGSKQDLSSSSAAAAQISFNEAGDQLVVTERATNKITTYPVGADGVAGEGTSYPSAGATPFGFEFSPDGSLIVSEAFGGAPNASAASVYDLGSDGSVNAFDGPIATNQTAACWLTITDDGRYAYTTNTGSDNVTGYIIRNTGRLELISKDGVSAVAGDGPIDMDFSPKSIFLYVVNAGDNSISIFSRSNFGRLNPIGTVSGLPKSVVGIAVD